jgi:hypothetical protein
MFEIITRPINKFINYAKKHKNTSLVIAYSIIVIILLLLIFLTDDNKSTGCIIGYVILGIAFIITTAGWIYANAAEEAVNVANEGLNSKLSEATQAADALTTQAADALTTQAADVLTARPASTYEPSPTITPLYNDPTLNYSFNTQTTPVLESQTTPVLESQTTPVLERQTTPVLERIGATNNYAELEN